MGFSYTDADKVLRGNVNVVNSEIVKKVKEMVEKNKFKLEVPYEIEVLKDDIK